MDESIFTFVFTCIITFLFLMFFYGGNKYFPYNTKKILSCIKQKPEKTFIAACQINYFYLKGPFLKIRLYDEFIIISRLSNRAIKINYTDGEIIKGVFSTYFKFRKNNNSYYIFVYSKEARQLLTDKITNAQSRKIQNEE